MVGLESSEFLLYKVIIKVFILNCIFVLSANGATIHTSASGVGNELQQKLDTADEIIESLALDICLDLQTYDKMTSYQDCENNFIKTNGHKDDVPPKIHLKCQYQMNLVYQLEPKQEPTSWTLVVLTPHNYTPDYLPYDLIEGTEKKLTTLEMYKLDQYTTWTAVVHNDGSHSGWRRGPEVRPWNVTGDQPRRQYSVQQQFGHEQVNESYTVSVYFTWQSLDEEDICFDFVHHCNGQSETIKILPNGPSGVNTGVVTGLPFGATCELRLTGKHGTTLFEYKTPPCKDVGACIDYEVVQNITVVAEPGAAGWDVRVAWARLREPVLYNVTLIADNTTRSVQLPGDVTETVFTEIEDSGYYLVAIGSVLQDWTAWTSEKAIFPEASAGERESGRWGALGSALGGAWGALAAAAALLAALAHRRRRARRLHALEPDDKPPKDGECDLGDLESIAAEDDWELRSERLLLHEVIGEGAFGVVRRGTLAPAGKEVAVKMLKDFPTLDELRSFRAEMELMKSVGVHPHIVSLVGCCSGRRPFIVAEYCSRGDLLSYLRCSWDVMVSKRNAKYYNNNIETTGYRNDLFKCKLQGEHTKLVVNKLYDLQGICDTDLTTRDLLSFCRQIAMGMEFLASNRLVHRDLAARNVLVSSDRTLKIADFGLSRDVYEENLYKQKGNGKMPMKWMAIESLTRRIYTSQSDVWSFGVVMWEVGSVGGSPYAGVPPARLPRLLRAGYRMPRPANCSKQLYEVMLACWREHPRARPTFAELHARLDELLHSAAAHDYLALQPHDEPPTRRPHSYRALLLRNKLGWSRGETYSRPMLTAQSNHYSSPPACTHKVQSVS